MVETHISQVSTENINKEGQANFEAVVMLLKPLRDCQPCWVCFHTPQSWQRIHHISKYKCLCSLPKHYI